MKNNKNFISFLLGIAMATVLLTAVGYACPVNTTIKITAADGFNFGSQEFVINIAEAGDRFEWALDSQTNITADNGDILGTIEYLKLETIKDPAIGLEFYIVAGSSATIFTVTATTVTFDPILNPEAYASAGITLTDRNQDGASITGLYSGKAYQALYNGASVYANLVSSFTAGVRKTVTLSENRPLTGDTEIITDTLFSIDSSFHFMLSARDSAAGTSYFEVVPEPTTICLLAIGSLTLIRRKK
jgi:hypothetical protein